MKARSQVGKVVGCLLASLSCKHYFSCTYLFLVLLLATSPRGCFAEEFNLRLEHFLPENSAPHREFFLPWAQRIEKASNGRIKVNVTPAMGLGGKPSDLMGQLERSEIDIAWTVLGYTPGRFPKLAVFELPWIVSSRAAVTSMALQEFYETYARDELAGIHVLAVWCYPSGVIMTNRRQVLTPDDLKGLKIRTPSTQSGLMLSGFGAEPARMPAPAVTGELDRGTIDGALLPYEGILSFKLEKRVRYITEFAGDRGLFTAVFVLGMSNSSYRQLPPDLRQVIDQNSGMELSEELGRLWDDIEEPGREAFDAAGGRVNFIKGEQYDEWYRRSQPILTEWIKEQNQRGIDADGLIKAARELVMKYSRQWMPY